MKKYIYPIIAIATIMLQYIPMLLGIFQVTNSHETLKQFSFAMFYIMNATSTIALLYLLQERGLKFMQRLFIVAMIVTQLATFYYPTYRLITLSEINETSPLWMLMNRLMGINAIIVQPIMIALFLRSHYWFLKNSQTK